MDNFLNQIAKEVEPFKDWIYENRSNPFFWGGLFMLGLVIFGITYNSLQKEK